MVETMYAIRRTDGELIWDEYAFMTVAGPDDWAPVEDDYADEAVEYEMVRTEVYPVARRMLPSCKDGCGEPARYWGLCEKHAREDDPDHFHPQGPRDEQEG